MTRMIVQHSKLPYFNHDTCTIHGTVRYMVVYDTWYCTIHGTCTMIIVQHSIIIIIRKCIARPIAVGDVGCTGPKKFGPTKFQFPGLFQGFSGTNQKMRVYQEFQDPYEPCNLNPPVNTMYTRKLLHLLVVSLYKYITVVLL